MDAEHGETNLSHDDLYKLAVLDIAEAGRVNDEMINYAERLMDTLPGDKDKGVPTIAAIAVTAYQFPPRNLGQAYGEMIYREAVRRAAGS